ncbi:MAG: Gfo/Idh/MocA family protein [Candidatus Nanohaloarchaea archaeon]
MQDLALVGCGYAGNQRLEELTSPLRSSRVNVEKLVDVDASAASDAYQQIRGSDIEGENLSIKEELSEEDYDTLDGVIVSTPHEYHADQVTEALENGTHVYVEKPLATSIEDIEQIEEALNGEDTFLWTGYQKRHEDRYYTARKLIEEGELGDIENVSALRVKNSRGAHGENWRADGSIAGGGQLLDIGNHMSDLIFWLTDMEPTEVHGVFDDRGMGVEIYANVVGKLDGETLFNLSVNAHGAPSIEQMYIAGSEASLEIDKTGLTYYDSGEGREINPVADEDSVPMDVFLRRLEGKIEIEPDIDTWKNSILFTEQAYEEADIDV